MEPADNTFLDGDGESALKGLERADPQTIEQKHDMADIILACVRALRGVVRELFGVPFNT